jgi:DNA-binding MarR family transcriptional regulator
MRKTTRTGLAERLPQGVGQRVARTLPDSVAVVSGLPAPVMRRFIQQPGFLLARINQIAAAIHAGAFRAETLVETLAQAEFLLLLAASAHPDQISLARAAGVDTSTTALILGNLEARGLISKEPDPDDRRRLMLCLTAGGRRQLTQARAAFLETQRRLVEPLGADGAAELARRLRLIGDNPLSPAPVWTPEDRQAGVGANMVTGSPGFLTRRALQICEAYFLSCTESLNLTPRQFSVLFIVNRHPQLSQVGFARLFGLDPATSALIMKNLTGRKLLDRKVSSSDRRERLYSLTPEGKRVLEAAQPLVDRSERLVLRALEKPEVRQLVGQLQQIVKAHSGRLGFPGACFESLKGRVTVGRRGSP